MRLFWINCLLLASIVTAVPNGRHKRDFSTIRNWIRTAIFGREQIRIEPSPILKTENGYQLYRLPGFDDEMIKVVPRKSIAKEFVRPELKPVNLNAFGSIVGTKSNKDTLVAVKKVNSLLKTGILNGNHNTVLKDSISPLFLTLNTDYVAVEKIKTVPVIEKKSVFKEVIKPYEEEIEFKVPFEPKYSYKQTQNNEPVMTYTAHTNPNVKVVETFTKTDLPMCLKERIDKAIMLGANPKQLAFGQKVYQFQPSPVVDISYPRVETNMYIQNPAYARITPEQLGTVINFESSPKRIKENHIRNHVRPVTSRPINPRPVPLFSHSVPKVDNVKVTPSKDSNNASTNKTYAFTNSGNKVELSHTLGPIPSHYLTSNASGLPKRTKINQMNVVKIVASKDKISNGKIPDNVYKFQINPNTGKVVQGVDTLKTDVKTNKNYFVPSGVNTNASNTHISKKKDGAYINNVTVTTQTVTLPAVSSTTNAPKENVVKENDHTFFKGNPTVVPDVKTYSYTKTNPDGSSLSIVGNKNGVIVDVKESNNKSRGDIPDEKRK